MRRALPLVMLSCVAVGYWLGYAARPSAPAMAQASPLQSQSGSPSLQRPGMIPLAPDQPAKEQFWSIDEFQKVHAARVATATAGKPALEGMRSRTHTAMVLTRLYRDKPAPSNFVKKMSQWDDAEQHQGVSDIYIIVGGSGTVVVGGEIQDRQYRPAGGPGSMLLPGEFVGQPIVGGRAYKVKVGDILNIPPDMAHHPQPGPDGLTYFLIKINVGLYPWSLSR